MSGTRHRLCNSFYEDFEKVELAQPCPVCLYHKTIVIGGSHPRTLIAKGNFSILKYHHTLIYLIHIPGIANLIVTNLILANLIVIYHSIDLIIIYLIS